MNPYLQDKKRRRLVFLEGKKKERIEKDKKGSLRGGK